VLCALSDRSACSTVKSSAGASAPALLEPRSLALFDGLPLKSKVCRLILKLFEAAENSAREQRHVPGRDLKRVGIALLRTSTSASAGSAMRLPAAAAGCGPASCLAADSSLPPPLSIDGESELIRGRVTPGVAPSQGGIT